MAEIRRIIYGYKMEDGSVKIDDLESKIVNDIYIMYINGNSSKKIAEILIKQDIIYNTTSKWNRTIVARILKNKEYTFSNKYPPIISESNYNEVNEKRKVYKITTAKEIKELKNKVYCSQCGAKVNRTLQKDKRERWKCSNNKEHIDKDFTDTILLSMTIEILSNKDIKVDDIKKECKEAEKIYKLKSEIIYMIQASEYSIEEINAKVLELAQERYENISEKIGCTIDLKLYLEKFRESEKLQEVLSILDKINICNKEVIDVIFK